MRPLSTMGGSAAQGDRVFSHGAIGSKVVHTIKQTTSDVMWCRSMERMHRGCTDGNDLSHKLYAIGH